MNKVLPIGLFLGLFSIFSSLAMAQETTPQPSPTAQASPTLQPTKTTTYDLFLLNKKGKDQLELFPDFTDDDAKLVIPTQSDLDEANKRFQKMKTDREHFELMLGLGGAPDITSDLSLNYTPAFTYEFAVGYRFSQQFSILFDFDGASFWPNNSKWDGNLTVNDLNLSLLAKLRFTSKGIRPYIFIGPGIGLGSYSLRYSFNGIAGDNSLYEGNFVMEGGVGVEVPLAKFFYLFLQGKGVYEFNQGNYASYIGIDQQSVYLPIEIGLTIAK